MDHVEETDGAYEPTQRHPESATNEDIHQNDTFTTLRGAAEPVGQ